MRAAMFFKVIQYGRKIYNKERCLFLADLCSVVSTPHVKDPEDLRDAFLKRANPDAYKEQALDVSDPRSFDIVHSAYRSLNPHLMGAPPSGRQ